MEELYKFFCYMDGDSPEVVQRRAALLSWFTASFPKQEFSGGERILYEFFAYASKLGVCLKSNYMDIFLATELKKLIVAENIKVPGTESIQLDTPSGIETATAITREYMSNMYFRLSQPNNLNLDDFIVYASEWLSKRRDKRIQEALTQAYDIISDTSNMENAAAFIQGAMADVEEIYADDVLEDLEYDNATSNKEHLEMLCDTGIDPIDADIGGIYETQLGGIEAQPGAGKTRFTLGVWVYRAAVVYKRNVAFYAMEQSVAEIRSILIARHVFELFGIIVDAKLIWKGDVPEDAKQKVETARFDLFESGKYGKIVIFDKVLYYDTLVETFKKDDRLHGPFKMIAVDYIGLIEQSEKRKGRALEDYQVIGRSMRRFKRYVRLTRKCGIAISQFNAKGITAGEADKEITTDMAQGGIEVYRNTDFNLDMSYTPQMRANNQRRFSQAKVRNSAGFGTFVAQTRLACAYFYVLANTKV